MTVSYGWVSPPSDLDSRLLPVPRGPWTDWLFEVLSGPVRSAPTPRLAVSDPLSDDDAALALYVLYELHYRGFEGVDEDWEWEPSLLGARARLEAVMLERLRDVAGVDEAPGDVAEALWQLVGEGGGRSLSAFLARSWPATAPSSRCVSSQCTARRTSSRRPTRTVGRSLG